MRLDSHTLFWWLSSRLSTSAHSVITDLDNEVIISAVNCYELLGPTAPSTFPK